MADKYTVLVRDFVKKHALGCTCSIEMRWKADDPNYPRFMEWRLEEW